MCTQLAPGTQHHQHEASTGGEGPGGQSGLPEPEFSPRCTGEQLDIEEKYQHYPFWGLAFLQVVRLKFIYRGTPLGRQGDFTFHPVQGLRVQSLVGELRCHKPRG